MLIAALYYQCYFALPVTKINSGIVMRYALKPLTFFMQNTNTSEYAQASEDYWQYYMTFIYIAWVVIRHVSFFTI